LSDHVDIPVLATAPDDRVAEWITRAEKDDVAYERLRDATLLNFQSEADIMLFLTSSVRANVALCGQQYIENNAHSFDHCLD